MSQSLKILVVFLCPCLSVYAEPQQVDFETVFVTATRMEMPAHETLSSIIVIDRDQIERSLAADVAELLRFHAGMELGRNGGPGQTTSLFMRGTESNHALVMIDGVEINPGTLGGAALQNISPRLIERIEIVKGPRSSLYGSDAIGGVVNIITRKTQGFSARAGGGRYDTREASLSTGVVTRVASMSGSLSQITSNGFPTLSEGGLPDRGYDNQSIGLNAAAGIGKSNLSFRHWQSSGNTEYLGYVFDPDALDYVIRPLDQNYLNRASAMVFARQAAKNWSATVTLGEITDNIEQQQGPFDYASTKRRTLDWQNDLRLGDRHKVVTGIYLSREKTRAESFGTGFDERTDVNAVYLEDYVDLRQGQLLLAARYTDHDEFGDSTTWNIEYGHTMPGGWRVTAAAGTGFRAPDATDRFGFGGNRALSSEESRNVELAMDRRFGKNHLFRISAFRHDIDNLIEYVFDPDTFDGANLNVAETRISGIDAGYQWRNASWELGVNALLQNPEDVQSGIQLARRAKRSLTVNGLRKFDRHSIGLNLLATSSRRDSAFSDTVNAGYLLANINGQWQFSERWSVQGRIENLLDRDYETAAGFRSPGRGLYLTAKYQSQ